MERLYWSMVGKHFPQSLVIQLLSIEIDQRIAMDLPTFALRERLEEQLMIYMDMTEYHSTKQKKAVRYVYKDLAKYTYEMESDFIVKFNHRNGRRFEYNLKSEEIVMTLDLGGVAVEEKMDLSATFERRGLIERVMVVRLPSGEMWNIMAEDIVYWNPPAVIQVLFELSVEEREVALTHTAKLNQELIQISLEIESLRGKMVEAIGTQMELLQDNVLWVSEQLDAKIVELMRLQKLKQA
ncbi:aspartyl-phosphate phosphatase Spo0E family protein [Paenibacillus hubeiensis]|uniref:aspartyl-phosphate phosphatase Spo0E family protein n=1 Tax=Paenibacillus hubeiensis TaxID=3077330 RepID=UPI0031BA6A5E